MHTVLCAWQNINTFAISGSVNLTLDKTISPLHKYDEIYVIIRYSKKANNRRVTKDSTYDVRIFRRTFKISHLSNELCKDIAVVTNALMQIVKKNIHTYNTIM